ncbi:MAG: bifunctional pyr operon transcriptional regulator/uracil phosphoribosyltransferase PyrR [Candidatus Limnocylindrales bacterium]
MSADDVRRALIRMSHEIVEKHGGVNDLALIGIQRRGVPLAERIRDLVADHERSELPVGALDISFHRDDRSRAERQPLIRGTDLSFDPAGLTIVIVDDVLFTGRTVRAGMDALIEHGRPAAIRLAVLIDRGHRELPIRADHVGKNVPTAREETIRVHLSQVDGVDEVLIERPDRSA